MSKNSNNKRVLALDILRGITIAGMLLVNNPGTWEHIYPPLEHAQWTGLTPTDLVFPFFIFVMGVSMYFSLNKYRFTLSWPLVGKIVRRTVLLFLIGWAVGWFSHLLRHLVQGEPFAVAANHLASMRYLGVFPRLALTYFFGAFIAVLFRHKWIPWVIGFILVAYALILGLGNGYEFSLDNIIARIDNSVLGSDHMYHESVDGVELSFDPEGILSTLPCIAHVLIGLMVGKMIHTVRNNEQRLGKLLLWGASLLLLGWLLQYGIPCGKKMWSTTFVLITCGMAMSVLGLLVHVIDIRGHKKWCRFFEAFGVNPLALYVLGTVMAIVFGSLPVGTAADGGHVTIHGLLHGMYTGWLDPSTASLYYAITFVLLVWIPGYFLFKKKIYIKI